MSLLHRGDQSSGLQGENYWFFWSSLYSPGQAVANLETVSLPSACSGGSTGKHNLSATITAQY